MVLTLLHVLWSHSQKNTLNVLLPSLFYLRFYFFKGIAAHYASEGFLDITACLIVPQIKNLIEFNQFKLLNLQSSIIMLLSPRVGKSSEMQ